MRSEICETVLVISYQKSYRKVLKDHISKNLGSFSQLSEKFLI